ncbi:hypothetical protein DM558_02215 [Entomomonas moraniae]|uniref:Phage MuF C-terminal domain-containing protein n=1 Tax=Entomomonas moraniae TaxID=2213226 RepID=A0A3S9XBB3_9GAMM|nr:hypothetical protein [Entomomonas moraniae]AZS49666.1 hypothetical protein DM558_02215 [Entomomonas moraniae]
MTDQNLSEVEEKELTEEGSQDNQSENPYLFIAKDVHKEQEKRKRKQILAIIRKQDEESRLRQNNTPLVSDEERAAREKKAEQRLQLRAENFGNGSWGNIPLSADEESLIKKKSSERRDQIGENLDTLSMDLTSIGAMQKMMLPDEYVKLLHNAKVLNVKPSVLYGMSADETRWIDESVKLKEGGISFSKTPVVSRYLREPSKAAIASDSIVNMQLIEDRIRRQTVYDSLSNNEKLHSTSSFDNFGYGVGKTNTLIRGVYTYGLNTVDEAATRLIGNFLPREHKDLALTASEMRKEARGMSLLEYAQDRESWHHDMRANNVGNIYDSKGFNAAIKYLSNNPGLIWTSIMQELPTMLAGGPAGKIVTKPLEIGLKKTILSTLSQKVLTKLAQNSAVGALSSSTNYGANLVQAWDGSHRDINKAINVANKKTSIEAAFGAASGMLPDKIVGGKGRLAKVVNGVSKTQVGIGINTLGSYVAATSVDENISKGALLANFLVGNMTAVAGSGMDHFPTIKKFNSEVAENKKNIKILEDSMVNDPLVKRDPDFMRSFIGEIVQDTDSAIKDVYVSANKFTEYFESKGIDPFLKAKELTGDINSLQEAMDLGTTLKIPLDNYLVDIVAAGHGKGFSQDISESPRSMTDNELSAFNDKQTSELPQIFEELNQKLAALHDKTQQSDVFKDVRQQLINIGEKEANAEHKALLYQSFFEKMAKHTDVDATALYTKYKLAITKDNLENLDTTHTRYAQTGKIEDLFKPHSDQAEHYRAMLDNAVNSLVSRDITLDLGNTPAVLQAVGAPKLTLKITRDVVRKATNGAKHDVSMDTIKNLPELLSDPVAVFKSNTEENSIVVLIDAVDGSNRSVIAAIHLDYAEKRNIQINKIASVYGKDSIDGFVKREVKNDRLLYSRNEESQNLVRSDGLQLPVDGSPRRGSDKSVLSPSDIVKYEQRKDGNTNGFIEIDNDGNVRINVSSTANLSTFLHETGHFFLHSLTDIANMPEAKHELKTDLAVIHQWLKVDETKGFTRKQHEQFARGFEAYLMTGKAPSPELKGAFERFKGWLIEIYRDVRNLNVPLSDDVRQVFDRMLASDKAIESAKSSTRPLFDNPLEANMSAKEYAQYKKNYSAIESRAKEKLFKRLVLEQKRIATKDWQEKQNNIRDEVSKEINKEPVYQVLDYLEKGILLDGKKSKSYKIDRQLLKDQFGEQVVRQLKSLTSNRDGVSPESLADVFGFSSAAEMVSALQKAPNKHMLINLEIQARMAKKYGDTLNDGSITEKAITLLENEDKANILKQEIIALSREGSAFEKSQLEGDNIKSIYDVMLNDEYLNNMAEQVLLRKTIEDINPDLYLVAGRSANQEAYDAIKKKNTRLAMEAKQRELLNHVLYIRALELKNNCKRNIENGYIKQQMNTGVGD